MHRTHVARNFEDLTSIGKGYIGILLYCIIVELYNIGRPSGIRGVFSQSDSLFFVIFPASLNNV